MIPVYVACLNLLGSVILLILLTMGQKPFSRLTLEAHSNPIIEDMLAKAVTSSYGRNGELVDNREIREGVELRFGMHFNVSGRRDHRPYSSQQMNEI